MGSFRSILEYYALTHTAYLHAKGEPATQLLVDRLDCQHGERILELGFGTGGTILRLAEHYRDTDFYGLEASKLMLQTTILRFRHVKSDAPVRLALYKDPGVIPFEDNQFDRVYVESMLAIQPGDELIHTLREIARVLRPGGNLVFNETMWLRTSTADEIARINATCREHFGIIQANGKYPYRADWEAVLEALDFKVLSMESVDELLEQPDPPQPLPPHRKSKQFSMRGALRAKMSNRLRKNYKEFERVSLQVMRGKAFLEGVLVTATNLKDDFSSEEE